MLDYDIVLYCTQVLHDKGCFSLVISKCRALAVAPCPARLAPAPFSSPGADTPEKENHRCHLFHRLRSMIVLGFALVGQLPHIFLKDLSFLASGQAEF